MRKLALLFAGALLCTMQLLAQNVTVTGRVIDAKTGALLQDVSITAAGTSVGTKTDAEGNYSITVPAGTKSLTFSYVGYKSITYGIGRVLSLNVELEPEETKLTEVVVTAQGIQKTRKELGFSVGTLNNEELTTARTTNIANALTGKVAGVRVAGANGMVGSGAAIFIRGFNTISGSNQPLFVVDGIPIDNGDGGNALQTGVTRSNRAIDLNQDDIENISVLKGPAASVLYGSRAASGAIIITTKKGRSRSKNTVQFNNSTQWVSVNRMPDYQNEYGQGGVEAGTFNPISNLSWGPRITGQSVTNFLGQQETLTAYPDNVRDIFQSGLNIQNNLSFTGGGNNTTFRLSYGNLYETGVIKNNEMIRHNLTFNGTSKLSNRLSAGFQGQYINSKSSRTQQGNQLANPLFRGWFLPRSFSLKNYPFQRPDGSNSYFEPNDNPLWTIEKNKFDDYVSRFIGNVNFKFDVNSWFNITYKFGGDFYNQNEFGFDEIGSNGQANTAAGSLGGIVERNFNVYGYYSYLNFNFKKTFFNDFDWSLVVGNESAWRGNRSSTVIGRSLSVRGFRNLSNAAVFNPSSSRADQFLTGVYGDMTVGYKGLASITLTGRNDWSSTFGADKRSYFYPSVAGTFNFTEAIPALKNSEVFSFGKVFANYARVGKEASPYSTNTFFGTAGSADGFGPTISYPFNGLPGFSLGNGAGDPALGPEFTTSVEIGGEFSFLKDRIGAEVAWYKSTSSDIIFSVPVAPGSGFSGYTTNAGELETKGWEVLLRGTPIKTKNGFWNVTFNFTQYETMCTRLAPGVPNIVLAGFVTPNARLEQGKPYGILFGSVFRRNADGQLWLNANGQAVLAPDNAQIGDPNPDWLLGVTNEIKYKGFNLTFLLDIKQGGDVFSRNIGDLRRSGAAAETGEFPRFNTDGTVNRPYVIQGVGPDGRTPNTVPLSSFNYWGNLFAFGTGESYVFDASWFRLRELSFGYTFPSTMFKNSFIGGLEIGFLGRNLFLHAPNFPHFDPENNVLGVSNAQGLEFNGLPSTRNMGFYLRTNF